jgi:hypothetical protein
MKIKKAELGKLADRVQARLRPLVLKGWVIVPPDVYEPTTDDLVAVFLDSRPRSEATSGLLDVLAARGVLTVRGEIVCEEGHAVWAGPYEEAVTRAILPGRCQTCGAKWEADIAREVVINRTWIAALTPTTAEAATVRDGISEEVRNLVEARLRATIPLGDAAEIASDIGALVKTRLNQRLTTTGGGLTREIIEDRLARGAENAKALDERLKRVVR